MKNNDEQAEGLAEEFTNDELSFVYCQQLDNMWSGHEHCWDVYQVSADMAKDKQPLPTQEYAFHREGGGEYNGFVITRR